MKYIDLINDFWRQNTIEPFRPLDAMIYLYLLNQCNLRYWQNPFSITFHTMETSLCVNYRTLKASLLRLQSRNLLTTNCRRYYPMTVALANVDKTTRAK